MFRWACWAIEIQDIPKCYPLSAKDVLWEVRDYLLPQNRPHAFFGWCWIVPHFIGFVEFSGVASLIVSTTTMPPSFAVKEQAVVPPRHENYSFIEVFFYAFPIMLVWLVGLKIIF